MNIGVVSEGWFWNGLASLVVMSIWVAGAAGYNPAAEWWNNNWQGVVTMVGVWFLPWLTYKSVKSVQSKGGGHEVSIGMVDK